VRYFHGGIPGLKVGDLLTPHPPNYVDNCEVCAAKKAGQNYAVDGQVVDPLTGRPDRIYITSDREYARFYASKFPRGDLYVVDPEGEMELSTEDHWPTWSAPAARVRSVYDRYVQLTAGQRRAMLKRWTAADIDALRRVREGHVPEVVQ
jgi:hypothetical protein